MVFDFVKECKVLVDKVSFCLLVRILKAKHNLRVAFFKVVNPVLFLDEVLLQVVNEATLVKSALHLHQQVFAIDRSVIL